MVKYIIRRDKSSVEDVGLGQLEAIVDKLRTLNANIIETRSRET